MPGVIVGLPGDDDGLLGLEVTEAGAVVISPVVLMRSFGASVSSPDALVLVSFGRFGICEDIDFPVL